MSAVLKAAVAQRPIALRTRGQRHGPITRLVSPSDIGELIKPFVFLDLFDISAAAAPNFGWHPHSGIATLTVLHKGAIEYQETTGVKGILPAGGVEWMRAGRGVWHTGAALQQAKGFQLWIALPEELENSPSQSHYLSAGPSARGDSPRGSFWAPMAAPRARSPRLRASTTWTFNSRQANDGPISRRWIMKWPGSQSPKGPYAHPSRCPPANCRVRGVQRRPFHSGGPRVEVRSRFRGQTPARLGARPLFGSHDSCGSRCGRVGDSTHRQSTRVPPDCSASISTLNYSCKGLS